MISLLSPILLIDIARVFIICTKPKFILFVRFSKSFCWSFAFCEVKWSPPYNGIMPIHWVRDYYHHSTLWRLYLAQLASIILNSSISRSHSLLLGEWDGGRRLESRVALMLSALDPKASHSSRFLHPCHRFMTSVEIDDLDRSTAWSWTPSWNFTSLSSKSSFWSECKASSLI